MLDNNPFKDEVAQEPAKCIKPPKPTRKPPPPPIPQVEDHIINVPVPKIKELNQALKGHAKSYGIELQDNLNPLNHFTKTKALVESHLESLLKDMKGFKFIEMLEATFEKETIDSKTGKRVSIYKTAFFNGNASVNSKHQHPPWATPGVLHSSAAPGPGFLMTFLMTFPWAGFLYIHKIMFSTVKKYTFTYGIWIIPPCAS